MRISLLAAFALLVFTAACGDGCDFNKMKDKAMQYKDKIPTDKIPTKMPGK
ncbi:MAG: hypothetical protein JNJ69_10255 [Leptospiraceae bacterium]|nr:hypothetical protein [Leptospiraceae bacterium]